MMVFASAVLAPPRQFLTALPPPTPINRGNVFLATLYLLKTYWFVPAGLIAAGVAYKVIKK